MAGKGFRLIWSPTTSDYEASRQMTAVYWPQVVNGSCKLNNIFIRAGQGTTIFDFKITSPSNNDIFVRKDIAGEINEPQNLMMRGIYTLTIDNVRTAEDVKVNDTFSCEFMFQDIKDK